MSNSNLPWVLGGAALVGLLLWQRKPVEDVVQSGVEDVAAALRGWETVNDGPVWVPVIRAAEAQFGIPTDLLARMAYQESRFRPEVIDGTKASPAGALGILQMMPHWFSTVRVPRPFTAADTNAQIQQAAQELVRLVNYYSGDWGLALAAYNDGQANIDNYLGGTHTLKPETINYVSQVLADVPVTGATIPA
jgi:soluble lytic murein transglycosylase-like protein